MARGIECDIPFLEVFIDTPLAVCESRDYKGLYRRTRAGGISDFTGISAPYDSPDAPDFFLRTQGCPVEQTATALIRHLMRVSAAQNRCSQLFNGRSMSRLRI